MTLSSKVVLAAVFFTAFPSWAFAQERADPRKIEISVNTSWRYSEKDEVSDSIHIGGDISYEVAPDILAGFYGGWSEADLDVKTTGAATFEGGSVTLIPLMGQLTFRQRALDRVFDFYAVAGAGILLAEDDGQSSLDLRSLRMETDSGLAAKFGVGLEWTLNEKWFLFLEASHFFTDAETEFVRTDTGNVADSQKLGFWLFSGGVRYVFD